MGIFTRKLCDQDWGVVKKIREGRKWSSASPPPPNRPLSRGGHFESQGNKKLCFCTSSLALNERLDVQNLLFEHCVIKVYRRPATYLGMLNVVGITDGTNKTRSVVKLL